MATKTQVGAWRLSLPQCSIGVTYSYSPNFDADLLEILSKSDEETRRLGDEYGWRPAAFAVFVAGRRGVAITDIVWEPVHYINAGKADVAVWMPIVNGHWDTMHMLHITAPDKRVLSTRESGTQYELPSPVEPTEILYATGANKIRSLAKLPSILDGKMDDSSTSQESAVQEGEDVWVGDSNLDFVERPGLDRHSFSIWESVEERDGERFTTTRRLKTGASTGFMFFGFFALLATACIGFHHYTSFRVALSIRERNCMYLHREPRQLVMPPNYKYTRCGWHGTMDVASTSCLSLLWPYTSTSSAGWRWLPLTPAPRRSRLPLRSLVLLPEYIRASSWFLDTWLLHR